MRHHSRRMAGLIALGLVAGCAGLSPYMVEYSETYRPGETRYSPALPVVVRGAAFAIPKPEFDAAVVDAMQGWSASADHFTATGDPNAAYRVVMVFNPQSAVYGRICQRPLIADSVFGAPPAPAVPLVAAVCRGDSYMSLVSGNVHVAGGPGNPAFRDDVGHVTGYLFPVQNPTWNSSKGCEHC
jgi:hypothetical protein